MIPVFQSRTVRPSTRAQKGAQITEFGAGLVLLTSLVILPLLDLTVVPVRWLMSQGMSDSYSRRLALSENFTQARQIMAERPTLAAQLEKLGGIAIRSSAMKLRISRLPPHAADAILIDAPAQLQPDWLPNGGKAPCRYAVQLNLDLMISPAVLVRIPGADIPGLTSPFPVAVTATHEWENLGRDPATGRYFLNE